MTSSRARAAASFAMTGSSSHFGGGAGVAVGMAVGALVGSVVDDGELVVAVAGSPRLTLPVEHATSRTASASEDTRIVGGTLV